MQRVADNRDKMGMGGGSGSMNVVELGDIKLDLDELKLFLVDAKRDCYASGKKEEIVNGVKRLVFQRGVFRYADEYSGFSRFHGTGTVNVASSFSEQKPIIWQMSYHGGMEVGFMHDNELTRDTFSFLKRALLQATPNRPFRGPETLKIGNSRMIDVATNGWTENSGFEYFAFTDGDITNFLGQEIIRSDEKGDRIVYKTSYMGGLIIPR